MQAAYRTYGRVCCIEKDTNGNPYVTNICQIPYLDKRKREDTGAAFSTRTYFLLLDCKDLFFLDTTSSWKYGKIKSQLFCGYKCMEPHYWLCYFWNKFEKAPKGFPLLIHVAMAKPKVRHIIWLEDYSDKPFSSKPVTWSLLLGQLRLEALLSFRAHVRGCYVRVGSIREIILWWSGRFWCTDA